MVSISFLYPKFLFFLFLIPLFIFIHLATLKATRTASLKFANFEAIGRVRGVDFISKNIIILFLSILIVFLLIMAMAGLRVHILADASTFSFVIALDSSKSMEADDLFPNRMGAAKKAAISFIDELPFGSRAGIISFSGNSYIEQDLTDNKGLMKEAINGIELSEISGTDIYEAIITGTNMLKGEDSKAIILLSDGQLNVGSIAETINYANDNDVAVHTIAVGTEEGGETSYGLSKVDEDSLKALSYNTQGASLKASDEEGLLNSFSEAMAKTEKKVAINISNYLIVVSVLFFALEYFLVNSRYRRLV